MEKEYCADIQKEISLLFSERSGCEDGLGTEKIAQHIAACDPCARHFQQMRQISGELRSASARVPEVAITPGFRRRLMESVSESRPAWFRIKPAWAALAPAAACLFLAFTLGHHSSVLKEGWSRYTTPLTVPATAATVRVDFDWKSKQEGTVSVCGIAFSERNQQNK